MLTTRTASLMTKAPASLVIDHLQPNFGLGTVSIHCLRIDADGNRTSGFDIDGVTKAELGIAPDAPLLGSLTEEMVTTFVTNVEGLSAVIDTPPAPSPATDEQPVPVATISPIPKSAP